MDRARTDVTDKRRPASCNFALNVQVPVQHVCAVRVGIDHSIANALPIEIEIGVGRTGSQSGRFVGSNDLKWRRSGSVQAELVRKRQHVKDPESRANSGFAVFEGIPGKADTWFKVFCRGIVGNRAASAHRTTKSCARGAVRKGLNLLKTSGGNGITVDSVARHV